MVGLLAGTTSEYSLVVDTTTESSGTSVDSVAKEGVQVSDTFQQDKIEGIRYRLDIGL